MRVSKLVTLSLIALSLLSMYAFAGKPATHPKTGEPLVIDCLRGAPKAIDGSLNDWPLSSLKPAVLDTKEQIFPGVAPGAAAWNGPNDSSGKFYIMWDEKNIYLGVIMKDDKLSMNKAGGDIWNADCIEIFFATTNAVAGHNEHYQYGFNANNQKWNWCNMDGAGQRDIDYLKVVSSKTGDGYICEVAIEYKNMKSLKFEAGEAIGFHPVFDDSDNGDRKLQMTWTGREAHDQSLGFGQFILSRQTASVGSAGKAVLTWGMIKKI